MLPFNTTHILRTKCRFLARMVYLSILRDLHNMVFQFEFEPYLFLALSKHSNLLVCKFHLQLQICLHILDLYAIFFYHAVISNLWSYGLMPSKFIIRQTQFYFQYVFALSSTHLLQMQITSRHRGCQKPHHKMLICIQ